MSAKSINWEILLIYFLLLIPWPPTQVVKMVCLRDNSRLVRKIVRSKWTPILDKYHVKLPLDCPFHPLRDLYAPRQDAKKRDRPTQWTCRLCGKSFYQEKFLDLHFETRHKPIINEAEDAVCVADYCDILRCEVFQTEESSLKIGDQHIVTDIEVWGDSLGQNSALAKANVAYLSLLPLRSSSVGATRASKFHNRQEQQPMQSTPAKNGATKSDTSSAIPISISVKETQSKRKEDHQTNGNVDESSGKQKKATVPRHQHQSSAEGASTNKNGAKKSDSRYSENATSGAGNSSEKNENGNTTNSQKIRANCKPEELSKLKAKCEFLVRTCIGSLLLSMTDQSFKEMEEEMNKAVCWYLTCDRYWEDGPLEPRAFPWGLILILIIILSTGICFCYYIIWILFDSEETTINAGGNNHHHHPMYLAQQAAGHHQFYQAYEYHGAQHPPPPQSQPTAGGGGGGEGLTMAQYQYYQQQQQQQQQASQAPQTAGDLYHEPQRYEYRHSPSRRYISDQRQPLQTAPAQSSGVNSGSAVGQGQTPLHHRHHHLSTGLASYPQEILDRREYISRPIATSIVSDTNSAGGGGGGSGPSSSAANLSGTSNTGMGMGSSSSSAGKPHYNTHPRPLATQHRHVGASQQSLRGSSSTHEIIQNEVGQNEHYIYVTYPPDLKKRYFEKYE